MACSKKVKIIFNLFIYEYAFQKYKTLSSSKTLNLWYKAMNMKVIALSQMGIFFTGVCPKTKNSRIDL